MPKKKQKTKSDQRMQKLLGMAKQLVEKHPTKLNYFRVPILRANGSTTALKKLQKDMSADKFETEIEGNALWVTFPVPGDWEDSSDIDTT